MIYNDKLIVTVETEEVKKYVDSHYFNCSYKLESSFRKAAGLSEHKMICADPPTKKHGKLYEFFFSK